MKFKLVPILIFLNLPISYAQRAIEPSWTHFYVDNVLLGSSFGTSGPIVADFDHDGDLDVIISRRDTKEVYWYERKNDSIWIPHLVGKLGNEAAEGLGCVGIDMDRDGWIDAVFEMVWFKNPGILAEYPDMSWEIFNYKGGGHDIVSCDINGDGKDEVIVYDGYKLSGYDPSNRMKETVISFGNNDHGGIAPHGFGDIDGDGDVDLVIPGFWFENNGDGTNWIKHSWPYVSVPNASYGRSIRAWIADVNKDGRNDIVYSNCDTGYSHVYWVENKDNGVSWVSHQLPDPPTKKGDVEGTGSFHSLGVADFNKDGFSDIFAGEQEDPDTYMEADGKVAMKPRGLKERGVIWYNNGNKTPDFSIFVIHVDNPGWHDAQLGDVDGDGDIDIISKIWSADGLVYHLDYWRNELIRK